MLCVNCQGKRDQRKFDWLINWLFGCRAESPRKGCSIVALLEVFVQSSILATERGQRFCQCRRTTGTSNMMRSLLFFRKDHSNTSGRNPGPENYMLSEIETHQKLIKRYCWFMSAAWLWEHKQLTSQKHLLGRQTDKFYWDTSPAG